VRKTVCFTSLWTSDPILAGCLDGRTEWGGFQFSFGVQVTVNTAMTSKGDQYSVVWQGTEIRVDFIRHQWNGTHEENWVLDPAEFETEIISLSFQCLLPGYDAHGGSKIFKFLLSTPWRRIDKVEVQLCSFLTFALVGFLCSNSCLGRFDSDKKPRYHLTRILYGPQSRKRLQNSLASRGKWTPYLLARPLVTQLTEQSPFHN